MKRRWAMDPSVWWHNPVSHQNLPVFFNWYYFIFVKDVIVVIVIFGVCHVFPACGDLFIGKSSCTQLNALGDDASKHGLRIIQY